MKKGISDANFIPNWDTEEFLVAAKKAGFAGVELNFREDEGDLTPKTTLAEANRLVQLAEACGIEIATLSTGLFNHYALSSADERIQQNGETIGLRMIELAAAMEVKVIQIVPGVADSHTPYDISYGRSVESLSRLGEKAAMAGITIGVENVCNRFLPSPREFARFLDEIGLPSVQAYFDSGNAFATGYPEHFVEILGERITAVHVKDYRRSIDDFVSILEGDINWPVMMNALNKIPYTGYLIATPHYPYTHCHSRHIEKYAQDLTSVLELVTPLQGVSSELQV